jgi:hypothetical protein
MATYLPFSDVVAAYGYRQPPQAKQRMNLVMLALAYVVMGGALGTVAGTGAAMATFHTGLPKIEFQVTPPVQASSATVNVVAPAAQTAALQTAELPSKAVSVPADIAKPSPLKLAKAISPAVHHAQPVHQQIAEVQPQGLTFVAPYVAPAAAAAPVERATPDATVAQAIPVVAGTEVSGYKFLSEGDATVADFDALQGIIETYEGRTFVLDSTAAASAPDSIQDSGASVHYRCDQSGSCTLYHAGLVLQNVRLM